ncbi:MAG: 50S ribosomal protein L5 [Nitrospirae bacterium]|nr:50S ribosomal protein L5 [Nitrospirota bacterium]
MTARLKQLYSKEVAGKLLKQLAAKNLFAVPRLSKIVLNSGIGEAKKAEGAKALENMTQVMAAITGQKPVVTRAKKSISNFGIRRGQSIGCRVTLRGDIMYEFLDRLVSIVLPRVRDFKGVSTKSFDGRGSYTLGLREQGIFPEVKFEWIDKPRGMNVTFVTTGKSSAETRELLALLGVPFQRS